MGAAVGVATNSEACYVAMTVTVGVLIISIYLLKGCFFTTSANKLNLPPGPRAWPVIGSLHLLGTHPHQGLTKLAQKYGPLVYLRLGRKPCIVASSPTTAMEFLKVQDANFSMRPPLKASQIILPNDFGWHDSTPVRLKLRKIFKVQLTGTKQLEAFRHAREDEVAHMLNAIPHDDSAIELKTHLGIMMSNILSFMLLNKRIMAYPGEQVEDLREFTDFRHIVDEVLVCFGAFYPGDFGIPAFKWMDLRGSEGRFRRLRASMEAFSANIIREHLERRMKGPVPDEEKDLVDLVLDEMEVNKEVTVDFITDIIWVSFVAGTETTVTTSEWAMAEMIHNPQIMKKARAEIDVVVGRDRRVRESDIPELKYIQAIVKETFRLHPPVPLLMPHMSANASKAFGYDIPGKTRLLVNVWAIGKDASVWKNPLEFNPERFFEEKWASTEFFGHHFELLPFGSGRRMCPGFATGALMVPAIIINLLHAFDWSLPSHMEPMDMSELPGLSCPRAVPLCAIAKARLPLDLYK